MKIKLNHLTCQYALFGRELERTRQMIRLCFGAYYLLCLCVLACVSRDQGSARETPPWCVVARANNE